MGDEKQPLLQNSENGPQDTVGQRKSDSLDERVGVREGEVDGGWGWLVVLACFLTNFVIDGVTYSFGMLMKPLMAEMEEGNFGCATIGSIQVNFVLNI